MIDRRIDMDFIGFFENLPVYQNILGPKFDDIAGNADHSFDKWDVAVRRGSEGDDVAAFDRSLREIRPNCHREVGRKNDFVEEEVIADEDRRLHGLCRYLCRLGDIIGKDQDEDDREDQAFGPLANDSFAPRTRSIEMLELLGEDVRFFKFDEIG